MSALSGVISPVSADNDIVIGEISTLSEISSEISAPETLTGSLSILSPDDVTGELSGTAEITAELSGISTVDGELNVPRFLDVSYYSGDYDVIPKTDKEIILPTLGLCMTYDVTVHKVPSLTTASLLPIEYDYNIGYIAAGSWVYENPTQTYIDIYEAIEGHIYYVSLGGTVGTRFRAMFTTVDIRDVTSGTIKGTQIVNTNNPNPYAYAHFTAAGDGYILIAKDNIGNSGLKSYVYDKTAWP